MVVCVAAPGTAAAAAAEPAVEPSRSSAVAGARAAGTEHEPTGAHTPRLAGARAAADEQELARSPAQVVASALATDRAGRAVAAVWSDVRPGGARLMVAFADPGGRFGVPRVALRGSRPFVSLGVAATPAGGVVVIAAARRRRAPDAILTVGATPAGVSPAVRLGRGMVVGRAPVVAVDGRGDTLAAWREPRGAVLARSVGGRWRRAAVLRGARGEPAVAASADGAAAALVARAGGRIDLLRAAPGGPLGPPGRFWPRGPERVCCALTLRDGGTLTAAWAEIGARRAWRARVAEAAAGGPARLLATVPLAGIPQRAPIAASGPGGEWLFGWWDTAARTTLALGGFGAPPTLQRLPAASFAPLTAAVVGAGGAAAVTGAFFGTATVAARTGPGLPLAPRAGVRGTPLGVALGPSGPLVLAVRDAAAGDIVVAAEG